VERLEVECNLEDVNSKGVRQLGLEWINNERLLRSTGEHILNELIHMAKGGVMYTVLGHTFIAPAFHLLEECYGRYVLYLWGTSGHGKTEIALAVQNFFGPFEKDDLSSWLHTPKSVVKAGHYFNGALYVVDDLKKRNLSESDWKEVKRIIQAYADGQGRQKLTRTSELMESEEIRGMMVITGEDIPEGEASTLARMLVLNIGELNPRRVSAWEKSKKRRFYYRNFMAHFIGWLQLREIESQGYVKSIAEHHYMEMMERKENFTGENKTRIMRNVALNLAGLHLLMNYIEHLGITQKERVQQTLKEHKNFMDQLLENTVRSGEEELYCNIFIEVLKSLIASGRIGVGTIRLKYDSMKRSYIETSEYSQNIIWKIDHQGNEVLVNSELAYNVVCENLRRAGRELGCTTKTLSSQLAEKGYLNPDMGEKDRIVERVTINGNPVKVWRFFPGVLNS